MDRRLIALSLGMFALGTDSFVVAGILPMVSTSMGVSIALVGQMVTLYAISYALLSPVVAAVFAHWPRKQLLLSGLLVFIVGNVMSAMAPTLTVLFASRLIAGLGAAMFSPTATSTGASLVPPERRGHALAIVIAGLTSATALGSPIGTFLGGLGDWRITMWFVAALGVVSGLLIWMLLPQVPSPPPVGLRQRLAPLGDSRVVLTLLTTFSAYCGVFIVYTYIGVTLDRITHGNGNILAGLLLVWGISATVGNIISGKLTDRLGSRRIINTVLVAAAINFVLLPWSSAHVATTIVALIVWGICGWGLLVPQQHRLLGIFPATGPLLMGLNSAATYLGVSASGILGGFGITYLDKYHLGWFGACFIVVAFVLAQLSHRVIVKRAVAVVDAPTMVELERS
ncbi:MAG TPA: MFS transporter [Luteibacter sp.]|jgi:DHA1 family inner membrane transport protein|nr:MFS transporter [Luteibacter sp.]